MVPRFVFLCANFARAAFVFSVQQERIDKVRGIGFPSALRSRMFGVSIRGTCAMCVDCAMLSEEVLAQLKQSFF